MLSGAGDICTVTLVMGESGEEGVAPRGAAHTHPLPAASRPGHRHSIALLSPLLSSLLRLPIIPFHIQHKIYFLATNFGWVSIYVERVCHIIMGLKNLPVLQSLSLSLSPKIENNENGYNCTRNE